MKYYDKIASGYDELYGREQVEKAKKILKYIKPRGVLLDIGTGTGIATKEFEKYCKCIALDPSKKLLEQYNGEKVVGKAEDIPFSDGYFDVVVSLTVLHHTNIKKALKEIFRVVKKDGQIAITILKKSNVDLSLFKDFKKIDIGKDWLFVSSNRINQTY
ncbi:MAG: class I SAM-dependent methyltransferase [Nanoarchaeota archaeon]